MRTNRSEYAANLSLVADPRAPIVGRTFHIPAPRRGKAPAASPWRWALSALRMIRTTR